jgi:hypothetical protein
MLDESNSWSLDTYYCPFDPPNYPTWTVTEHLTINGTQEINGIIYKQVYNDNQVSCLLREDNGVVYKYFASSNSEKVLFDFNFEVGDVYNLIGSGFNYPYCAGQGHSSGPYFIEVYEIEILNIAGADRKVIKFIDQIFPNGGEVLRWIEGIGTRAGLTVPWEEWDFTCGSLLACFETNGINYFMNGATSCDNTTLNVNSFFLEKIILYPNPVRNISILQLPAKLSIDLIKIYNLSGKLVKEDNINKDYYTINAMDYANGLYFYQIYSYQKLISTQRFIVK